MKKEIIGILLLCSSVYAHNLQNRNGVYYEINQEKPFSGSATDKYPSGQISAKYNLKNGKYHGKIQKYYENGQLSLEENYKDGKPDGDVKVYNLFVDGNYKDGDLILR